MNRDEQKYYNYNHSSSEHDCAKKIDVLMLTLQLLPSILTCSMFRSNSVTAI